MKQVGHTQAPQARFAQFDQGLGPITDEIEDPCTQGLKPGCHPSVPGVVSPIRCGLFKHEIATGQVHEHQHHALQKRFIDRPNDRSHLTLWDTLMLPCLSGLQNRLL